MKSTLCIGMLCLLAVTVWAQAPASPPAQTPPAAPLAPGATPAGFGGSAYAEARDLPARILDFKVQPASIRPGQSVTMEWLAENPLGEVTISPEPGRGVPRRPRQMTPSVTTTYTLTVRGPADQRLTST